ncbi:MAG: hypothetical protein R3253_08660 [Longimicrobiales bacterium]|nr:hypothetical protein [Longimicrobiales bacterium]
MPLPSSSRSEAERSRVDGDTIDCAPFGRVRLIVGGSMEGPGRGDVRTAL